MKYRIPLVPLAQTLNPSPGPQAEQFIDERHRHRYEVNPEMVEELEAAGLRFVGRDETGMRMEIVELGPEAGHPFFVGAQFHPEVRSLSAVPTAQGLGTLCLSSACVWSGCSFERDHSAFARSERSSLWCQIVGHRVTNVDLRHLCPPSLSILYERVLLLS